MIDRYVYFARFSNGEVIELLSLNAEWSPRPVGSVIDDIERAKARYFIDWESGPVELRVVHVDGCPPRLEPLGPSGALGGINALPRA